MWPTWLIFMCFKFILEIKIANTQFIFDTTSTCEYETINKHVILNSNIWNVTHSNKQILFTLCGDELKSHPKNINKESRAIIYNKQHPNVIIDAGSYFEVNHKFYANKTITRKRKKYKQQELPVVLSSQGGSTCATNSSYKHSLIITIDMKLVDKEEAEVTKAEECSYNITIRPNVEPYCTKLFRGNLIDFRHFEDKEFIIKNNNRTFVLALCGVAQSCNNEDVSACEIRNGTIQPIGDTDQEIIFNQRNIVIKSKWGSLITLLNINCNWKVDELIGNYLVPPSQGKNFKFDIDSKYGCIKYPMQCLVRDDENYLYDLSSLNKMQGWKVGNITNGNLFINICGPLKRNVAKCTTVYSQACYYDKTTALNYGSMLGELLVKNDVVVAKFIGGDECPKNNQLKLSTNIFFECAWKEGGPKLLNTNNCSIDISWKTPSACPKYVDSYKNCAANDIYGNRNLKSLYGEVDRNHTINKKTYLRYSICGKLRTSCNNESQTSACLHVDGKEYVMGYLKTDVEVNHTALYMNLTGEYCKDKSYKRKISINFYCDYEQSTIPSVKVTVMEDSCSYVMDIRTILACTSTKKISCTPQDKLDLTSLALKDKNYVIKRKNLDFIFNLCNPIILTDNVLCPPDVGACIRNNTEPSIKKRFVSFGKPYEFVVNDRNVSFNYVNGKLCRETMFDKRSSIIFICSNNMNIELKEKNSCFYEILWKTNAVCLQRKIRNKINCLYQTDTHKMINLSNVDNKTVKLNFDKKTNITLELCKGTYINETVDEKAYEVETNVQLIEELDGYYLMYRLKQKCGSNDSIGIQIHLECSTDYGETTYKLIKTSYCLYELVLKSVSLCNLVESVSNQKNVICTVGNMETQRLNLISFAPLKVKDVVINLDFKDCPSISYDCKDSSAKLTYIDYERKCLQDFYAYDIWLKCNASFESPSIKNMSTCSSRIIYPSNNACLLLNCPTNTAGIVSGIVVSLAALTIFLIMIYVFYRRRRNYKTLNKEATQIYIRNTLL